MLLQLTILSLLVHQWLYYLLILNQVRSLLVLEEQKFPPNHSLLPFICSPVIFFSTFSLHLDFVVFTHIYVLSRLHRFCFCPKLGSLLHICRCFPQLFPSPPAPQPSMLNRAGLQYYIFPVVAVQLLSHVWLFVTSWTAALQAPLSFTVSRSLLKVMSIESVTPSNHLILSPPLLFLPSIFPSIRVFFNE